MFGTILSMFISAFSTKAAANTAVDLVRKFSNLNGLTEEQKYKLSIEYINATKHQSPVRRFLATLVGCLWAACVVLWIIFCILGNLFDIKGAITTAGLMFTMVKELAPYVSLILTFYFTMSILNRMKS